VVFTNLVSYLALSTPSLYFSTLFAGTGLVESDTGKTITCFGTENSYFGYCAFPETSVKLKRAFRSPADLAHRGTPIGGVALAG